VLGDHSDSRNHLSSLFLEILHPRSGEHSQMFVSQRFDLSLGEVPPVPSPYGGSVRSFSVGHTVSSVSFSIAMNTEMSVLRSVSGRKCNGKNDGSKVPSM
jgi:hypothetical protein